MGWSTRSNGPSITRTTIEAIASTGSGPSSSNLPAASRDRGNVAIDGSPRTLDHSGDDLQVVFHAMVDFLEQGLLFAQRSVELFLGGLVFGNVLADRDVFDRFALGV